MTTVISILGFVIIAMCVWGMATPKLMMEVISGFLDRPWGIYLAIAGRLALGLIFILAADSTRYPGFINFMGYLMIIAAGLIALMGRKRLKKFIKWWVDSSMLVARSWLVLGVVFGIFLVHSAN